MKNIYLVIFSIGLVIILSACSARDQVTSGTSEQTSSLSSSGLTGQARVDELEKQLSKVMSETAYKQDSYLIWEDKVEELKLEIERERIALLPPEEAATLIASKWLTLFEIAQRFYLYEAIENECNNLLLAVDRKVCRVEGFTINFGFLTGLTQSSDATPDAYGVIKKVGTNQDTSTDENISQYDFYNHYRDPNSMSITQFVSHVVGIPLANTKFLNRFDFMTIADLLCWESAVLFTVEGQISDDIVDCPLSNHVADISVTAGKPVSRTLQSTETVTSFPGLPDGEYIVIEFLTDFERQQGLKETIVTSKEIATDIEWERFGIGKNTSKIHLLTYPPRQDNVWRIYSYQVT